jgi:hypothetical protein
MRDDDIEDALAVAGALDHALKLESLVVGSRGDRVRRTRQRRPSVLCHPCLHLPLLSRDRQIVLGLLAC